MTESKGVGLADMKALAELGYEPLPVEAEALAAMDALKAAEEE